MTHFHEYRGHDEAPRMVALPVARCLDTRGAPRAMNGENAEYCPPSERVELAVDMLKGVILFVAGLAFISLGAWVIQIGGTALRGAW